MEDQEIVQLIWDRQEHGLRELSTKYNGYCYSVSYRIVHDAEDARECVNDTWLIWHWRSCRNVFLMAEESRSVSSFRN